MIRIMRANNVKDKDNEGRGQQCVIRIMRANNVNTNICQEEESALSLSVCVRHLYEISHATQFFKG